LLLEKLAQQGLLANLRLGDGTVDFGMAIVALLRKKYPIYFDRNTYTVVVTLILVVVTRFFASTWSHSVRSCRIPLCA
jgi:hypothetical protein